MPPYFPKVIQEQMLTLLSLRRREKSEFLRGTGEDELSKTDQTYE